MVLPVVWQRSSLVLPEYRSEQHWHHELRNKAPHQWYPPDLEPLLGLLGIIHGRAARPSLPIHNFGRGHDCVFYTADCVLCGVR